MNRGLIAGAALGLLVVAGGGYLVYRNTLETAPTAAPLPGGPYGATPASAPGAPRGPGALGPLSAPPPAGVATGNTPQAPWLGSGRNGAPATTALPIGKAGAPSIEEIQQRLQRLSAAGGQPNLKELDAILADLQRNQGSAVVAGVNLQALRDNLARTERIQQLAQEMQGLAATNTPDAPARLQAMVKEIQQLQSAMQPTAATPAQGAR